MIAAGHSHGSGSCLAWLARQQRLHPAWFLAVLLLLALLLRLPHFASRPLWLDEVYQLHISEAPGFGGVLERVTWEDRNPPAYALLIHLALNLGDSEAWLRLPSLVGGVACVWLGWLVGRHWLGRRGGIVLAAFCALSPPYVFYAREARPYATGLLGVLVFLLAVARHGRRPSWGTTLFLAAAAVACLLWQYANAVIVAFGLLAVLPWVRARGRFDRRFLTGWTAVGLLAAGVVLVCATRFMHAQLQVQGTGAGQWFLKDYFFQLTSWHSTWTFLITQPERLAAYMLRGDWSWALELAALSGAILALGTAWAIGRPGRGHALLLLAGGSLLAFGVLAGLGLHPLGGIRHCLPLTPVLFLLASAGVIWLGRRSAIGADVVLWLLLLPMLCGNCWVIPDWATHDVPGILARLRPISQPGDTVLLVGEDACAVFRHYFAQDPWPVRIELLPTPGPEAPAEDIRRKVQAALAQGRRLWLVDLPPYPESDLLLRKSATCRGRIDRRGARVTLWVERGSSDRNCNEADATEE